MAEWSKVTDFGSELEIAAVHIIPLLSVKGQNNKRIVWKRVNAEEKQMNCELTMNVLLTSEFVLCASSRQSEGKMSDVQKDKSERHRHKTNMNLEENNPCLKEHRASLKCLDKNGYDKDACGNYFANYRACMGFWNRVRAERRQRGIKPELPPVTEREAIRREHYGK
ncbi:Coiled-coil-helix-coiled-coil-helix domain-containing protein 7 [Homalodisca vitripennis]|nr:Coiled-coil-helix-coiled-coil-helix domain-containing protein 7 [Homalodisca vitripennis]